MSTGCCQILCSANQKHFFLVSHYGCSQVRPYMESQEPESVSLSCKHTNIAFDIPVFIQGQCKAEFSGFAHIIFSVYFLQQFYNVSVCVCACLWRAGFWEDGPCQAAKSSGRLIRLIPAVQFFFFFFLLVCFFGLHIHYKRSYFEGCALQRSHLQAVQPTLSRISHFRRVTIIKLTVVPCKE